MNTACKRCRIFRSISWICLTSFWISLHAGCQTENPSAAEVATGTTRSGEPFVIAICYPLQFLTEQICGDVIEVQSAIPPAVDGETFRPSREDILKMQTADLIVANGNGAQYAKWLETISVPESKLCLTATRGLALTDYIPVEDIRYVHSHGPEGEHSHATMVAYTWLDPAMARKQAGYIAQRLAKTFPEQTALFEKNLSKLNDQLDELSSLLGNHDDSTPTVITANPRLKFLTRAAGVNDKHLNWFDPPTLEQAAKDLEAVCPLSDNINSLNDSNAPVDGSQVFLSTYPVGTELEKLLNKHGLNVVVIDPIGQPNSQADYLVTMRQNIEKLNQSLGRL